MWRLSLADWGDMPLTFLHGSGWRSTVLLLVMTALFSPAGFAASPAENTGHTQLQASVSDAVALLEPADSPRAYLSDSFVSMATGIDHFFGDPRYFQQANNSVVQLYLTEIMEPGGISQFKFDGQAKIDLPATQKRFSLILESDPEKNTGGDVKPTQQYIPNTRIASDNQSLALRYEKRDIPSWYFSADVGIKAHIPLDNFARSRASFTTPLGDWQLKASESLFWFNTIGAGETSQLDFDKKISEPLLFRSSSIATWLVEKLNFDLRQDFSLYQTLNEREALLYQTSAIGVSQPQWEVTEYVALLLYRKRLHRQWVFCEISPQLHFPIAKNYQVSPLLMVRMELLFDALK